MDLVALHGRGKVEPAIIFLSDGPLVEEARKLGIPVEVFPAPAMRRLLAAEGAKRALARRLVALKADLVHSVMAWGHAYAGEAARLARVPAVWYQHTVPHRWHWEDILAALMPARRILANSVLTANAQHRFNPRRVPIEVVYPGTRIPSEARAVRRERGRQALGIGPDVFAVGIAARLIQSKGQDTVIRAAASLLHARGDCCLFVIGSAAFGPDRDYPERLKRLAAGLQIADRVVFTGFRDDVADCLAGLDVAVHASVLPEAFGLGLTEAMAAGTALVAADGGAVREIAEPGVNALLVPPGDHEALAAALLALHDDPIQRERIATAGAETVKRRFDVRETVRRVEKIYRDVLAR
jgi:glycosyltransferase involved in cell wall biosynthesis